MADVHPTAVVAPTAELAEGVVIGPFCCVGPQVKLARDVKLVSHVVVDGATVVGPGTVIYPFASIGLAPQDLKYKGEPSRLEIGAGNVIREHVTMNPGTAGGGMITRVGDNGLFMVGAHVAHDCLIGNNVIMANNATLGGHVVVEDFAIIGGLSAVHQFVRIGRHAMIGGMSGVETDVIPYGSVFGERASLQGLNVVGLKRRGFSRDEIQALRCAYRTLFSGEGELKERLAEVERDYGDRKTVAEVVAFVRSGSNRGLCLPRRADGE